MSAIDVESILSEMTLEEKASLLTGDGFWRTRAIERLGIPSITLSDGPHGVRRQPEGDHLGIGGSYPATCFPPAVALGSSWDPELVERVGVALGAEADALDVQVLLGPGINIKRSPLCGRNFEYLSEDPLIAGELGAALIRGVQSQGVGTSLKHFAANNQETDRLRVSAEVDERTLREIYLAGFERAVTSAHPETVMCSYNRINGVYASENRWLLTEVLRDEWGYDGLVVSDWGAVNDRDAGVAAGLDLEMPESGSGPAAVVAAVREGRLDESDVDTAVRNVLRLIARHQDALGSRSMELPPTLSAEHHVLARDVAARSIVLLKNEGGVLPLGRGANIAVIGEFARTPRYQGAGSSQIVPTQLDDALSEIEKLASASVTFAAGYEIGGSLPGADAHPATTARALVDEAVNAARAADVAVVFLGLPSIAESEGYDRLDIDLPADQLALLAAVAHVQANVVVVLSNGSVVRTSDWDSQASAIVEGWLLGQAGGGATADVLFGVVNPSGRLAETIPLRLQDTPAFGNFPGAFGRVRYGEGVFVGYRWYDERDMEVAYPFGHGLSYTRFEYSNLSASVRGADADLAIDVTVTVANVGAVAGREVVQLYVAAPSRQLERPVRELRGFHSIELQPGESSEVSFTLGYRDLAYFHPALKRWYAESGRVSIHAGASSRDLRVSADVEVSVTEPIPALTRESTIAEWLAHPGGSAALAPLIQQMAGEQGGGLLSSEGLAMVGSMPLRRIGQFPGFGLDEQTLDALLQQANA